jgi:hypothetical protein
MPDYVSRRSQITDADGHSPDFDPDTGSMPVEIVDAAGTAALVDTTSKGLIVTVKDTGGDALLVDSNGAASVAVQDANGDALAIDSNGAASVAVQDANGDALAIDGSGSASVSLRDSSGNLVNIDSLTKALTCISYQHHAVHAGSHFTSGHFNATLGNNANLDISIRVGSNKELHMVLTGAAGGNAWGILYEGLTVTGGAWGTSLTPRNNRRSSATTSDALIAHTPTVNSAGTSLQQALLPGGTGGNAGGGSSETRLEWILKPDTNYLARITNISGATKPASLGLFWYEETPPA